jgi:transcriptional regulator with XRE-family HTH domain
MEVGGVLRDLRTGAGMSQEELAEKVLVSRQTISNWENDKFYPDVQSLAIVAELFDVSIDSLVKGDLSMIDATIAENDARAFKRNATLYGTLLTVSLVAMVVSFALENWLALALGTFVYALSLYFAFLFERDKRKHDVRTYREVKALCNGASVDEVQALRAPERLGLAVMKRVAIAGSAGAAIGFATAWTTRLLQ